MPKKTQMAFKIVLTGNTFSGKSSIVRQYIKSIFDDTFEKTIAALYIRGELNVNDYPVQQDLV